MFPELGFVEPVAVELGPAEPVEVGTAGPELVDTADWELFAFEPMGLVEHIAVGVAAVAPGTAPIAEPETVTAAERCQQVVWPPVDDSDFVAEIAVKVATEPAVGS